MNQVSTAQTPSFWQRHPEYSLPEMLTTAEKTDLVETGTVFHILSVRRIEHRQYGPTWVLTVDLVGFARSMFLSCNEVRDAMLEDVAEYLESATEVPATLVSFVTGNGYEAWGIAPPPDTYESVPAELEG